MGGRGFRCARGVPNAPCGVESVIYIFILANFVDNVPNVPCGVESANLFPAAEFYVAVPNAPCGVERKFGVE